MRTRISPQTFTLINNTLKWFKDEDHWTKGKWGLGYDPDYGDLTGLEKDQLTRFTEIQSACFAGGLLVNNNFQEDKTYFEAVAALAELVDKSSGLEFEKDNWEEAEYLITSFNDRNETTIEDVRSVFRRAVNKFRRHS